MEHKEQVFAERMAATGDKAYAAAAAGYSQPAVGAHRALARPGVQAEIARQQVAKLFETALPAAVACLVSIMTDTKAPAGARVQASKVVLDRTLGSDDAKQAKEPHEMTPEEIANAIATLERVAADRARPVANASQEPDIFE